MIGPGPAGLAAADQINRAGHCDCTVSRPTGGPLGCHQRIQLTEKQPRTSIERLGSCLEEEEMADGYCTPLYCEKHLVSSDRHRTSSIPVNSAEPVLNGLPCESILAVWKRGSEGTVWIY